MKTDDKKFAEDMLVKALDAKSRPLLVENSRTPEEIKIALNRMLEISTRLINKLK